APGAWVMSYRVFYESVSEEASFYTAEGLAALEDMVRDGADVVNNSWGGGPSGIGGELDPTDWALINASRAGVFVSMSAGNAGPGKGTVDHPSDAYINVAASTTSGSIAMDGLRISGPDPVPEHLGDYVGVGFADFGPQLPQNKILNYHFITAKSVNPDNIEGCDPWEGSPFTGKAVVIRRADCNFTDKVYNAQLAGAQLAIIYNNQGDDTMTMGGTNSNINIPSIFVGQSFGETLESWYEANGDASTLELSTAGAEMHVTPDIIVDFSSRGPGVGNVLRPDIAAPGVNILSQGYAPGAEGEARHLGYGQASGTSMAAPFVAGAAALLRQIHPDWSNAYIKSALMSTAKYLGITTHYGNPAQPLDMGAGRLDFTHAADPGVILSPPSLSFGALTQPDPKTLEVRMTSVASERQTYNITTLYTGDGFDSTTSLPGFTVVPDSVTLDPGQSSAFTVVFNPSQTPGLGDKQGYIIMQGNDYQAHMPVWARIEAERTGNLLVIDADSSADDGFPDYREYYTAALDELQLSYDVWDQDEHVEGEITIPQAHELSAYKAIVLFTGDNYHETVTDFDMDALTEYVNGGGIIVAMGQDLSDVLGFSPDNSHFFCDSVLGFSVLQDGLAGSDENDPDFLRWPIVPVSSAPPAFHDVFVSVSRGGDGAGNQLAMDEIEPDKAFDELHEPEIAGTCFPLLKYVGRNSQQDGVTALAHRDMPTLVRPGITYSGRTVFAGFGLEGVNNAEGFTTRSELLRTFLNWAMDEPVAIITEVPSENASNLKIFEASVESNIEGTEGVSYEWDFGDGSATVGSAKGKTASHVYRRDGNYTVRVEATDSWGNRAIGTLEIAVRGTETGIESWNLHK
ncbi:MAG: S8 family serine peptidase, partial [bacterium]